ncbi:MAG TPA: response regulator transcription factor [Longilinea sp.]|nr:response regulator transcription factor [Longilinea sp.]
MPETIMIVDDEIALQETLAYNLKHQGYLVETVSDGAAALELARKIHPDLIILDIMLPGMDGFEVCRTLRQEASTPVLMLTARDNEIDRVVGLEVGADDYLTKPFSMRELLARVKAMLRRVRMIRDEVTPTNDSPIAHKLLKFTNLTIDDTRREVTLDGIPLPLKPKEYELLIYFAQHQGQVISREQLVDKVWGWDYFGDSRTVDVHVRWLRQKIEKDSSVPTRLVTVRGAGYRFEG